MASPDTLCSKEEIDERIEVHQGFAGTVVPGSKYERSQYVRGGCLLDPTRADYPACVLQLQVRHRNSVAPGTGIAWHKFLDSLPPFACLHAFPQLMSGRRPPVLRSRKLPTRVSHLAHKLFSATLNASIALDQLAPLCL